MIQCSIACMNASSRKLLDNSDPQCACSRIATGYMKAADLDRFHDENGTSFREAASAAGFKAASSQVGLDHSPSGM